MMGTVPIALPLLSTNTQTRILCSVDRAPQYNRVRKNQPDAQLILSKFRQPLHVSGTSRPIIRRYNHPGWINPIRTTDSLLKIIISINCCIHTVVPPDDGPRYA